MNDIDNKDAHTTDILMEAFETASDPMLIIIQQNIVLINAACKKLFGWSTEDVIGKDFTEFTLDSAPMRNYLKGISRKKTDDFYPAKIQGKQGPINVNVCSTEIRIKGKYGRFVIFK